MRKTVLNIIVFMMTISLMHADSDIAPDTLAKKYGKSFNYFISGVELPESLDICGDIIPLDMPDIRERAEREFYLLLQQPGQIMLYIKRSGRLFPMYEKILAEAGLPDDLKYLSVAESALYQSQSHAGAVGLWQFMPATAKELGLVVGKHVDERRHPEKSTRAAVKYLKRGYKATNSWALTLAGYNMGFTGVKRRLTSQYGTDYYDLFLNSETSRFVFRVAIIKELMKNAEKYGFVVPDYKKYKPYKTKTVDVTGPIADLTDWAVTQGTNYKYIRLLNPWILGDYLPAPRNAPWQILIPED